MIGVDTNVLVRAVFEDHPKESPLAQQFLKQTAKDKKLFVSSYAVLEMVWVLKVKQRSRQEIYEAVLDLLDSPGIMVGQREVVMSALEKYIKGKADFGDYLILSEGEHYQVPRLVSSIKFSVEKNKELNLYGKHLATEITSLVGVASRNEQSTYSVVHVVTRPLTPTKFSNGYKLHLDPTGLPDLDSLWQPPTPSL